MLISFGCSMTYGQGLPDNFDTQTKTNLGFPSKHAWPEVLASKLDHSVLNLGRSGSSNKQIVLDALRTSVEPTDTVIILWTFFHRSAIIGDDGTVVQILPESQANYHSSEALKYGNDFWNNYYKVHTDMDMFVDSMLNVRLVNHHFYTQGVKVFNFYFDTLMWKYLQLHSEYSPDNDMHFISLHDLEIDAGEDGVHPGPKTQINIADAMYRIIEETND